MHALQDLAWSDRHCRTLNSEKKAFLQFCKAADIEFLPVSGDQLSLYALWLWKVRGLQAPKSIRGYLSAVSTLHKRLDLPCHTPTSYGPLGHLLAGHARKVQHQVKKALPITPEILLNLLHSRPHNPDCPIQTNTLTTYVALTLLLFQTMSRSSNMVSESRTKVDLRYVLTWKKIQKLTDGILITVGMSKTNQFGTNLHLIPLAQSDNPMFCPLATLAKLAKMYGPRHVSKTSPVFLIPTNDGSSFVPLKKSEYVKWLKTRLGQMGLPAARYGVHSFRHGAVQEAVILEDNRALIQLASGHSSDALMGYAAIPPERRFNLSFKINHSLSVASQNQL